MNGRARGAVLLIPDKPMRTFPHVDILAGFGVLEFISAPNSKSTDDIVCCAAGHLWLGTTRFDYGRLSMDRLLSTGDVLGGKVHVLMLAPIQKSFYSRHKCKLPSWIAGCIILLFIA